MRFFDSQPLLGVVALVLCVSSTQASAQSEPIDWLSFSRGALPIAFQGDAESVRSGFAEALATIDGNSAGFGISQKPVTDASTIEFIYELPAMTTFTSLAVPAIVETRSPSQTFVRSIEVTGSTVGPEGPFEVLAKGTLETHPDLHSTTELEFIATKPVRWVGIRLQGGIDVQTEKYFLEFSELIGHGSQEPVADEEGFSGGWKYRANVLDLNQDGTLVSGCYDDDGELTGTVTGNVLRATGIDLVDGVKSIFLLLLDDEGNIQGVRSTNGAPFSRYFLPKVGDGITGRCSRETPPQIGCGSVLHGIRFDFDSAELKKESAPLLAQLYGGLVGAPSEEIVVEGHTSSEGSEAYNQDLSERRAQAVVDDLVRRGIDPSRIRALGMGELDPIADNEDEAGRSLNRRVEIDCSAGGS